MFSCLVGTVIAVPVHNWTCVNAKEGVRSKDRMIWLFEGGTDAACETEDIDHLCLEWKI